MGFWIAAALMCAVVFAAVLRGMARGFEGLHDQATLTVYKDQLREVERDAARGLLGPEDAARTRTEIARKLLAADAVAGTTGHAAPQTGAGRKTGIALAMSLVLISGVTYWQIGAPGFPDLPLAERLEMIETARANRPDQAQAEAQAAPAMPAPGVTEEVEAMVVQLRQILETRPDDLRGFRLLARNETALGNLRAAWRAQARVVTLMGAEVTADEIATLGELKVLAAGGYVSPEAEADFARALEMQPGNGTARYYLGLMYAQGGRADIALPLWKRLIADSTPDAPWLAPIYAQIERVSIEAGDPTPLDALPQPGASGPSPEDIEAAGALSLNERMEMIQGMVQGLADRLASEGGPAQDWARLINALGVLGDLNSAAQVWEEARVVFAQDPGALDVLAAAADRAGLAPQ